VNADGTWRENDKKIIEYSQWYYAVVEIPPHQLKVKGLSTAAADGAWRENGKKY
jgi:hypothetical protein